MSSHAEAETAVHVHGPTVPTFAKVWITLLVLTGFEVFLAYEQVPTLIMLTVLIGLSVIKAALCALTAEKSSGCAKANRNAPYPPMEIPLMARAARLLRMRYLPSMCGMNSCRKKSL